MLISGHSYGGQYGGGHQGYGGHQYGGGYETQGYQPQYGSGKYLIWNLHFSRRA